MHLQVVWSRTARDGPGRSIQPWASSNWYKRSSREDGWTSCLKQHRQEDRYRPGDPGKVPA